MGPGNKVGSPMYISSAIDMISYVYIVYIYYCFYVSTYTCIVYIYICICRRLPIHKLLDDLRSLVGTQQVPCASSCSLQGLRKNHLGTAKVLSEELGFIDDPDLEEIHRPEPCKSQYNGPIVPILHSGGNISWAKSWFLVLLPCIYEIYSSALDL